MFGQNSEVGSNPAAFFDALISGTSSYGSIMYDATAGSQIRGSVAPVGETTSDSLDDRPNAPLTANGAGYVADKVLVTVNTAGLDRKASDWIARILLHELGHVYNMLSVAPGSAFLHDVNPDGSPNDDAQSFNRKLEEKCIPVINKV